MKKKYTKLLFLLAAMISISYLKAQDLYVGSGTSLYIGNGTTLSVGGNVSFNNAATVSGTGLLLLNGTTAQTIDGGYTTSGPSINYLQISNAAGVSLTGSNLRIDSALTLQAGNLMTGSNTLVLGELASATGSATAYIVPASGSGSGYIKQLLSQTNSPGKLYNYPTGDTTGTAEYSPISFSLNNAATVASGAYYQLGLVNKDHPNRINLHTSYINRYWPVTQSGLSNYTISYQGNYVAADVAGSAAAIKGSTYSNGWVYNNGASATSVVTGDVTNLSNFDVFGQNIGVTVSPKVFLQGAMSGTSMTTTLRTANLIPLSQPYNTTAFSNYNGGETITALPAGVTDWVMVDLRDATTPTTIIASRAAFVKSDGSIVDVDGLSPVDFLTKASAGNYFVGIRHRNHLAIRSAAGAGLLALSELNTKSYDFTTAQAAAYQNAAITSNTAMKDLGNGKFAMWGGNGNSNTASNYGAFGSDRIFLLTQPNTPGLITRGLGNDQSQSVSGVYSNNDLNLNGTINYGAFGSDRIFLLVNVLGNSQATTINQHL